MRRGIYRKVKRIPGAAAMLLTGLLCCGCGAEALNRYQFADAVMGTVLQQSVYASDGETAETMAEGIYALLDELEEQEISWRLEGSGLYAANESAGSAEGILLSEELTMLLTRSTKLSGEAEGVLDVTLLPVVELWNIDARAAEGGTAGFVPPDEEELTRALALCGGEKLKLVPETFGDGGEILRARLFMPEGMRLDLGAVGKGAALDHIKDFLEQNNVRGAVISLGGCILTYGEKPDKTPWKVGIVNPRDASSNIALLSLQGQWCVSTSGDYERYVEADGVRYHHIIDPSTGMPADSGVCSVTVLTQDGFLSDALSTACFILGEEKGMALAERYGAETLFVTADGSIFMSEGMRQYLGKR